MQPLTVSVSDKEHRVDGCGKNAVLSSEKACHYSYSACKVNACFALAHNASYGPRLDPPRGAASLLATLTAIPWVKLPSHSRLGRASANSACTSPPEARRIIGPAPAHTTRWQSPFFMRRMFPIF